MKNIHTYVSVPHRFRFIATYLLISVQQTAEEDGRVQLLERKRMLQNVKKGLSLSCYYDVKNTCSTLRCFCQFELIKFRQSNL